MDLSSDAAATQARLALAVSGQFPLKCDSLRHRVPGRTAPAIPQLRGLRTAHIANAYPAVGCLSVGTKGGKWRKG